MNLADIAGKASPSKTTVRLCFDGERQAEREALQRELLELPPTKTIVGNPRKAEIDKRLAELTAEMAESEVEFTFVALSRAEFAAIKTANPDGDDGACTPAFFRALTKASLHDPDNTFDTWFDTLSEGQADLLESTAWMVNQQTVSVPFTASGSATTPS